MVAALVPVGSRKNILAKERSLHTNPSDQRAAYRHCQIMRMLKFVIVIALVLPNIQWAIILKLASFQASFLAVNQPRVRAGVA